MPSPADRAADIVRRGFEEFHATFRAVTRRALERFEQADWEGIRRDTERRLGLHNRGVTDTLEELEATLGEAIDDRELWERMKRAFSISSLGTDDFELAQTFFNSLTRRVFSHTGIDPRIDFTAEDFPLPFRGWEMARTRTYAARAVEPVVLRRVLEDAPFRSPFEDLEEDSRRAAELVRERLRQLTGAEEIDALDFLLPVFIRNKAAYVIGRARRFDVVLPVVLVIARGEQGLKLDDVVTDESQISILFSFARWYFHADLESPRQVIGFLSSILPRKRIAELYISLGYNKHGKTELYTDLTSHIATSEETFVRAPGQPGMVMSVFTLPSYEFVFKVIKDTFPTVKRTSRERIRDRYRLVFAHDRVGRLVDFQEFEYLEFPRERFSEELLAELLEEAGQTVCLQGERVVVKHLYVGRRVTPLDLYLRGGDDSLREHAVIDWGFAIKELAAANIFAGDMVLKNFGVTRHGRVVFYDYDELCPLEDCRFRSLPEARDDDRELAAEPWFTVREGDVFPAELRTFLGLTGEVRDCFEDHHADLYEVDFWRDLQERNERGEVVDFYPYSVR